MKRKRTSPPTPTPLRQRAETRLREQTRRNQADTAAARSHADTKRKLHELQVRQVELEMQNEELKKARDEMEVGLEKYSELYDFAPVGYLTLDKDGTIREANLTAASLLGIPRAPLVKRPLALFVATTSRPSFDTFLRQVFKTKERKECDVQLAVNDQAPVDIRLRANLTESGKMVLVAMTDITQHKLAEVVSAKLAAIVSSSTDAIIGKDLNSRITSWNSGAENLFGYSAAEILGEPIRRLIPAHRQHEEARIISRIIQGESVEQFETVRVTKEGRNLDVAVTISPIKQADGKIVGASKVARDITWQKLAANKMRTSEIRYRRLFEAAHDGVLLIDPKTRRITDANPFMTKLLGYRQDELIGKELFEIGLLKDQNASQKMFRMLKRKHAVRYEDLPLKSREGWHQEVEVVANLYEEDGQEIIQCNIRDITERKKIDRALRESEDRYRSLFTSIDEGFCVIELIFNKKGQAVDYRLLEVNPSFEKQSGIHRGEGKLISEIAPGTELFWFDTYGKVALTGTPIRFSHEAKSAGRWFEVYAFRMGGEGSRKVAVLFNNITVRKRIEEALHQAQLKLTDYAGKLERMVAKRTGELTTANQRLLGTVVAAEKSKQQYQQLFLESQVMQKKLRELTRQIVSAQEDERKEISRELHDHVVQMLVGINVKLSALTQGLPAGLAVVKQRIARTQHLVETSVHAVHRFARELRPAALDDLGLIPALHAYNRNLAEQKNIRIHLTAFAGIETLESAKRTVLFRVAQEAMTNVVRHAQASSVKMTITQIPGAVRMEINDNGKSFQVRKTLLAKTNKRLGLVGMRERIEMVGGSLTIESAPGQGTTVRAELPFTSEKNKL